MNFASADSEAPMNRSLRLLAFALAATLAGFSPVLAYDLPYFAGRDLPSLKAVGSPDYESAPSNPWSGLTMGAGVVGVSGAGRGTHGGFGGEAFVGYNHEFDNRVVLGIQATAGALPGIYNYGPRGYNFGMVNMSVGYDMGRFMPYITAGVGTARATNFVTPSGGFDSLNNIFSRSAQSTTIATVGAGFNYAVTNNLHVGFEVNAVQQRNSGFGPPIAPQPGALP
jgi:opacity protein-like surface antigen